MNPTSAAHPLLEVFEGHHRGLVERLAALSDALDACRHRHGAYRQGDLDRQRVRSCLHSLQLMAEIHFADEEKLMDDVQFPDRREHADRHRELLGLIGGMAAMAARDDEPPGDPAEHLAAWWREHALGPDRALTDFLCRGGI